MEGAGMNSTPASALAGHQFTRGMPPDYIAALAGAARHIRVPARHRLVDEGGTAGRVWLIQARQGGPDMQVPGAGLVGIGTPGLGEGIGLAGAVSPVPRWGVRLRALC